jgi:hypothetical protein
MSSSKSSQSSQTTNITETITPSLVTSDGGSNTSIVAESFRGDVGLTGFDAVNILSDFQDLQRDTAVLNAQTTTNALIAAGKGSGGNASFMPPSVTVGGTSSGGGEAPSVSDVGRLQTTVLLLGGAAAIATVFALRK